MYLSLKKQLHFYDGAVVGLPVFTGFVRTKSLPTHKNSGWIVAWVERELFEKPLSVNHPPAHAQ